MPHFLRCHLSLIRLLDRAQELRLLSDVHDEGEFWHLRNIPALARQVGEWDALVAREIGQWPGLVGGSVLTPLS